ncbi:MAG: trypsin-like peptidase domain-containing protein, partial [Chloroflexi bacterium]|nr:trypsin-like peptidase domain-containing protein [Chloroflexota bacterium]
FRYTPPAKPGKPSKDSIVVPSSAAFATDTLEGAAPLTVNFSNTSTNADGFHWDFGNGDITDTKAASDSVSERYTKTGTYTVTLSATNSASGGQPNTSTATIKVRPGPLVSAQLNLAQATLQPGARQQFTVTAADEFGNAITDLSARFSASGSAGAIGNDGAFTATTTAGSYNNGVTVDVSSGGVQKTLIADVTVQSGPLDRITINPSEIRLRVSETQQVRVSAADQFGNVLNDVQFSYQADSSAGTVSSDGLFAAGTKAGRVSGGLTITATRGSVTKSSRLDVTVAAGALKKVTVSPDSATFDIGDKRQFSAQALDSFGNVIDGARFAWTVNQAGDITDQGNYTAGTKAGAFTDGVKVTATASSDSLSATAAITVKPGPVASVAIDPIIVTAGVSQQLRLSTADKYGNPISQTQGTWNVLDANGGTVDVSGQLRAGEVAGVFKDAIEAVSGSGQHVKASVTITAGDLDHVVVGPSTITLGPGLKQNFVAVPVDRFGNRVKGATMSWKVDNGGGTIDATTGAFTAGTRTGTFNRTVTVSALLNGVTKTASASVTVQGDRIYFRSDRSGGASGYLMDADGSNVSEFPASANGLCSASPSGRLLACTNASGLVIIGEDGTRSTVISSANSGTIALFPVWSPDGRKIVFVASRDNVGDVWICDLDGANLKNLTNTSAIDEASAAFAPDSKEVVILQKTVVPSGQLPSSAVVKMNLDGTNKRTIFTLGGLDVPIGTISPDGTEIAFVSFRELHAEIYIMNVDGSNQRRLTNTTTPSSLSSSIPLNYGPVFSSDGTRILFYSARDGTRQIYIMHRDGTNQIRLTNNQAQEQFPTWIPKKAGLDVSANTLVIPGASALKGPSTQTLVANSRGAVVRIAITTAAGNGNGSGVIIDPSGLILTANHVISEAKTITVRTDDGTDYPATLVGRDSVRDLALIQIKGKDLPVLALGDASHIALGSSLLVLGFPLGQTGLNSTSGIASALTQESGRNAFVIQTDSAVNPGNSGGPMLDQHGDIVGVVVSGIASAQNISQAVSANTVLQVLDRMKKGETITS